MKRLMLVTVMAAVAVVGPLAFAASAQTPNITEVATALDEVWVVIAGILVMFMQAGFALVESGFTRA
ncbi:MAG: ammonium transporter, partial [Acidimicrobiia bacterium]|nr:ammonium transporter [Acidimicrobiia bacterium]